MDKRINLVKSRQTRAYTHTHTICRMKSYVNYNKKTKHTHYAINDGRTIVIKAKKERNRERVRARESDKHI